MKRPKIHILRTDYAKNQITVLFEGKNWTKIRIFPCDIRMITLQGIAFDLAQSHKGA